MIAKLAQRQRLKDGALHVARPAAQGCPHHHEDARNAGDAGKYAVGKSDRAVDEPAAEADRRERGPHQAIGAEQNEDDADRGFHQTARRPIAE